jgi:LmbE family N-acetylglucosaminyl deacetylase
MKAMAMVAHPDDCVIFAYSYMHNHPEYTWTVCYLTYTESDPRGQEFADFWRRRHIAVNFLGHADIWNVEENCPGNIEIDLATQDIQQAIADQDLVLTHNSQGEYGHPHHVIVHHATANHPRRILFAKFGEGTVKYSLDNNVYNLDEFPLHQDIVRQFHVNGHVNEYTE